MSDNVAQSFQAAHPLDEGIRAAAESLKAAGAREVYLFGSVATGQADAGSDVDLAVSGLPPERFFRAMGNAREILRKPLDLVDLDEDTPFARYLRQHGGLIHVL